MNCMAKNPAATALGIAGMERRKGLVSGEAVVAYGFVNILSLFFRSMKALSFCGRRFMMKVIRLVSHQTLRCILTNSVLSYYHHPNL
jgi:hypothetical protein